MKTVIFTINSNISSFNAQMTALAATTRNAEQATARNEAALASYNQAQDKAIKSTAELAEAQEKLRLATSKGAPSTELAKLKNDETKASQAQTKALQDEEAAATRRNKAANDMAYADQNVARQSDMVFASVGKVAALFGGALLAGFGEATKSAVAWEAEMARVQALTGLTTGETQQLSNQILTMSTTVPIAAKDLAEGFIAIHKEGYTAAESITILNEAARLAVSTNTDLATSAKNVSTVMNVFQQNLLGGVQVINQLQVAAKMSGGSVNDLLQGLVTMAPTMKIALGDSKDAITQVVAAMAAMTQGGLNAQQASMALQRVVLQAGKDGSVLSNVLVEVAHAHGDTADATGADILAHKGLIATIQLLNQATGGELDQLEKLYPSIRAFRGVAALAVDGSSNLTKAYLALGDTTAIATTAEQQYHAQLNTTSSQMKILENDFHQSGVEIGNSFLPILKVVIGALQDITTLFSQQSPWIRTLIVGVTAAGAAFLAFGGILAMLKPMLSSYGDIWDRITKSTKTSTDVETANVETKTALTGATETETAAKVENTLATETNTGASEANAGAKALETTGDLAEAAAAGTEGTADLAAGFTKPTVGRNALGQFTKIGGEAGAGAEVAPVAEGVVGGGAAAGAGAALPEAAAVLPEAAGIGALGTAAIFALPVIAGLGAAMVALHHSAQGAADVKQYAQAWTSEAQGLKGSTEVLIQHNLYNDKLLQSSKQLGTTEEELTTSILGVTGGLRQGSDVQVARTNLTNDFSKAIGLSTDNLKAHGYTMSQINTIQADLPKAVNGSNKAYHDLDDALHSNVVGYASLGDATIEAQGLLHKHTEEVNRAEQGYRQALKANKDLSDQLGNTNLGVIKGKQYFQDFDGTMTQLDGSVNQVSADLTALQSTFKSELDPSSIFKAAQSLQSAAMTSPVSVSQAFSETTTQITSAQQKWADAQAKAYKESVKYQEEQLKSQNDAQVIQYQQQLSYAQAHDEKLGGLESQQTKQLKAELAARQQAIQDQLDADPRATADYYLQGNAGPVPSTADKLQTYMLPSKQDLQINFDDVKNHLDAVAAAAQQRRNDLGAIKSKMETDASTFGVTGPEDIQTVLDGLSKFGPEGSHAIDDLAQTLIRGVQGPQFQKAVSFIQEAILAGKPTVTPAAQDLSFVFKDRINKLGRFKDNLIKLGSMGYGDLARYFIQAGPDSVDTLEALVSGGTTRADLAQMNEAAASANDLYNPADPTSQGKIAQLKADVDAATSAAMASAATGTISSYQKLLSDSHLSTDQAKNLGDNLSQDLLNNAVVTLPVALKLEGQAGTPQTPVSMLQGMGTLINPVLAGASANDTGLNDDIYFLQVEGYPARDIAALGSAAAIHTTAQNLRQVLQSHGKNLPTPWSSTPIDEGGGAGGTNATSVVTRGANGSTTIAPGPGYQPGSSAGAPGIPGLSGGAPLTGGKLPDPTKYGGSSGQSFNINGMNEPVVNNPPASSGTAWGQLWTTNGIQLMKNPYRGAWYDVTTGHHLGQIDWNKYPIIVEPNVKNPSSYWIAPGVPIMPMAEGHQALIAAPGMTRVWNEPETGGEAYIPLSSAKRGRSTSILAAVAGQFGYGLSHQEQGGYYPAGPDMVGGRASSSTSVVNVHHNETITSDTNYQFQGPIIGYSLEQVTADADRKSRLAALKGSR